jgi:hypothetical protein
LKYCPRIIFYIKNIPPERIIWRKKSNVTLGPLLFLAYINDMPETIMHSETRLFAEP